MSTPDPSTPPSTGSTAKASARPSHASRYLFLLLFGLVIGVIATVMTLRALEARRDHFPDALMHVQQWHMGQIKTAVEMNHCNPTDVLPHLQALRMTSNDLEAAFPGLRDDARFKEASAAMRAAADKAIATPPLSCAAAGETLKSIGQTCKGCHRDFRG